jgi:hypothetical protein
VEISFELLCIPASSYLLFNSRKKRRIKQTTPSLLLPAELEHLL